MLNVVICYVSSVRKLAKCSCCAGVKKIVKSVKNMKTSTSLSSFCRIWCRCFRVKLKCMFSFHNDRNIFQFSVEENVCCVSHLLSLVHCNNFSCPVYPLCFFVNKTFVLSCSVAERTAQCMPVCFIHNRVFHVSWQIDSKQSVRHTWEFWQGLQLSYVSEMAVDNYTACK